MGRQKMQAEAAQEDAEKSAELAAIADEANPRQPGTAAPISYDPEAYRQDIAVDVFRALVHGIRIEVKHTDVPADVAERMLELHAKLMLKAEQAGIIPGKVETI